MKLKTNCRHILWDRPCRFHKEIGTECGHCANYMPRGKNILIIKLDAMGDVLRTTSILEGLKAKYPNSFITWITMPVSEQLLLNNPYIDRVFTRDLDILGILQNEEFDLVLNPDASLRGALLASAARSKGKLGYHYKNRKVVPLNKEAEYWYNMGMDDKLKKENAKTYQNIILDMLRLPKEKHNIMLKLTDKEISFGREFAQKNNLLGKKPVIGINTGAGGRWILKSWPIDKTLDVIKLIDEKIQGAKIILLGGPEEKEKNKIIISKVEAPVIDSSTGNSLREFIALVNLCDLLVVSDSLALHIALGLGKKVVVLFGPTSSNEIELYGRGIHLNAPIGCKCCYKRICDKNPNCMDLITPKKVLQCIQKLL